MVKISYCIHVTGLLRDKNKDHNVSPVQDKNVSAFVFFPSGSFKNDKQTSHHSFPSGPFPPDERKIPSFSSLNDASPEEVIVASNSYIWYCAYILNAVVLGEMSAIYISICNKL